jgi:plasmid stability protein
VRTTLTLDDDVAAKLRERARRTGQSFRAVVNDTLRQGLNAKRALVPDRPFKVKARSLGLRPGLSYDNVADLLEQLEGPSGG